MTQRDTAQISHQASAAAAGAAAAAADENRFQRLLEGVNAIAVQGYDRQRRVIFWNDASTRLYGYTAAEAMGRHLEDLIIPLPMREGVVEAVNGWLSSGAFWMPAEELMLRHKNGDPVRVISSHTMQVNATGEAEMYCVDIDIGARVQAESALRVSEQSFRALTALSSDWYWATDASHRIVATTASETGDSVMNTAAQAGRAYWELPFAPSDASAWWRCRDAMNRHQPFFDFELRRQGDDGRQRVYCISGTPRIDEGGAFAGYHGVGRDLTSLHEAEQRRLELEGQLREAQKMEALGTLAGGIAHDFNNVLGSVLVGLSLARQDAAKGLGVDERLAQIESSALRARAVVQQILSFSRRDAPVLRRVALAPLVEDVAQLMRATLPAGVALHTMLADSPLEMRADGNQLHQLLMNLCINAWQALEGNAGEIVIGLAAAPARMLAGGPAGDAPTGPCAHLWVSDSGCGMDEATQSRIFEPFFTTKPLGAGTGLGLSVVHGIVTAHGGVVRMHSKPGKGSVFNVYLPAIDHVTEAAPLGDGGADIEQGNGQHVVYVDDDEVLMTLVLQLLQRAGYRVTGCSNGQEALGLIAAGTDAVDVLVTDYNMPGLSGMVVARKALALVPQLPVIISSGFLPEDVRLEALRMGVRDLLRKEHTVDELVWRIGRVLRAQGTD
jgi:PAS domain S-box-containing protein